MYKTIDLHSVSGLYCFIFRRVMQVTIKTLANSVFKIDTELDVDVTELKQKIQDQGKNPQEYPTERQKLIYQVVILYNQCISI